MVTLKDIAGEAGVSAATVSNVVNGRNTQVLYLKNAIAVFSSFGGEPRAVKF